MIVYLHEPHFICDAEGNLRSVTSPGWVDEKTFPEIVKDEPKTCERPKCACGGQPWREDLYLYISTKKELSL